MPSSPCCGCPMLRVVNWQREMRVSNDVDPLYKDINKTLYSAPSFKNIPLLKHTILDSDKSSFHYSWINNKVNFIMLNRFHQLLVTRYCGVLLFVSESDLSFLILLPTIDFFRVLWGATGVYRRFRCRPRTKSSPPSISFYQLWNWLTNNFRCL